MINYETLTALYEELTELQENLPQQTTVEQAEFLNEKIDFIHLLMYHDWTYRRSDDMRVWRKEKSNFEKISFYVNKHKEFKLLFDEYMIFLRGLEGER